MESLIAPLQGSKTATNETTRLKLQDSLRSAADAMETPHDVMLRLFNANLEVTVVKVGCDLGLFKVLAASHEPLSVEQLAKPSGGDPLLIGRLLRYLASVRMINEVGKDLFFASNATNALADPRINDSMSYIFNIGGPAYQAVPSFLKENRYQTNARGKCAWHKGFNTELDFFPWAKQNPKSLGWFQQLMSVPREGDWLDVVPFADTVVDMPADRPLFVDVGGSIGHQSARLRARYPAIRNRIIVQDLEETIEAAPVVPGVEFMIHNFFQVQPIQGAKFYYLRTVLHDWNDEKAQDILMKLVPAMSPDSLILIDEMALPTTGAHWWSTCLDLHMYTMLGALERNVDQWTNLLDSSGLKLVDVRTYMPMMSHSIVVASLK